MLPIDAMAEEDFLNACDSAFKLNQIDQSTMITVLIHLGILVKKKVENITLYYLKELAEHSEVDINALLQEVIIGRKLVIFNNKIAEIENATEKINQDLLLLKHQNYH